MTDFSPAATPFASSYAGFSNDGLQALANAQAAYNPQAPFANQNEALDLIRSAQTATDPNLKTELLQRALALLTPQGGNQTAAAQPASFPSSAPASSYAAPSYTPSAAGTPATSASADTAGGSTGLTSDPSTNSVNTGRYTITAGTGDDGSLTIHDNQTGKDVEVWGDPHIKVDGKDVADFQKNGLTIQLQDGTQVHIQPTSVDGNGKAHIDQVAVTKGDQAVTMSGFTGGGLHTSDVMNGQAANVSALYNAPGETNITEGDDDNLYYNNANGSMGAQITATNGQETSLDGAGGGSITDPQSTASAASSATGGGDYNALIQELLAAVASNASGLTANMLNSALEQLQSTSGYAQA